MPTRSASSSATLQRVRAHENRRPLPREAAQNVLHHPRASRVQPHHRLVHHDHLRTVQQRRGDDHALLHAVGNTPPPGRPGNRAARAPRKAPRSCARPLPATSDTSARRIPGTRARSVCRRDTARPGCGSAAPSPRPIPSGCRARRSGPSPRPHAANPRSTGSSSSSPPRSGRRRRRIPPSARPGSSGLPPSSRRIASSASRSQSRRIRPFMTNLRNLRIRYKASGSSRRSVNPRTFSLTTSPCGFAQTVAS